MRSSRLIILILLLTLLGGGIRLINLSGKSLWQDEVFTLASATGNNLFEVTLGLTDTQPEETDPLSLSDPKTPVKAEYYVRQVTTIQPWSSFWHALSHNIQAPLYPVLSRLWGSLFGFSATAMRILSVLLGTLCIPAMAWLAWRISQGNRIFTLLGTAILSFSGFQVTYSQTARVYVLVTLLSILSTACLLEVLARPERRQRLRFWGAYLITTLLGLYAQYLFQFVLLFQGTYFLYRVFAEHRGAKKPLLQEGITYLLTLGLGYLPWIPLALTQIAFLGNVGHGNLSGLWKPLPLIDRLWNLLTELISPKTKWLQIFLTGLSSVGLLLCFWRPRTLPFTRGILILAGFWLGIYLAAMLGLDVVNQTHRILSKRYTMLASPALYLLLTAALLQITQALPKRLTPFLIGLIPLCLLHNSLEVVSGAKFIAKEDYQGAAHWISQHKSTPSVVLVNHSGIHAVGIAYYLPPTTRMLGIHRRTATHPWTDQELAQHLQQAVSTQQPTDLWLVLTHATDPTKTQLLTWLNTHTHRIDEKKLSGVTVIHFQRSTQ